MAPAHIHSTIDFAKPGKHLGYLQFKEPGEQAPILWQLPIGVVSGGGRPAALVMSTGEPDAIAGQVAILRMMRDLEPDRVAGSVLLLPAVNDATDLEPDSRRVEAMSEFLKSVLFPLVDIVVEIHGGRGQLRFHPCAELPAVDDGRRTAMFEGALAWNTDFALLGCDSPLAIEAERQGKVVIAAEMASKLPSAELHTLAQDGLANVLIHLGIVDGCQTTRSERGQSPTRWLEAASRDNYRFAPESGIYESLVPLGGEVDAGQPIGMIHFPAQPERPGQTVVAHARGVLLATLAGSTVAQGDCVACIAQDVARPTTKA